MILHPCASNSQEAQDASQLFADRQALSRRQNQPGVLAPGGAPIGMKIADVERVKDAAVFRGEFQLPLVRLSGQTSIESSDHPNAAGTKRGDEIAVHRVLIDVNPYYVHG